MALIRAFGGGRIETTKIGRPSLFLSWLLGFGLGSLLGCLLGWLSCFLGGGFLAGLAAFLAAGFLAAGFLAAFLGVFLTAFLAAGFLAFFGVLGFLAALGFVAFFSFLGLGCSPSLKEPAAPVPLTCFRGTLLHTALEETADEWYDAVHVNLVVGGDVLLDGGKRRTLAGPSGR